MKILSSFQPKFFPILRELAKENEIFVTHAQFERMLTDIDVPSKFVGKLLTPVQKQEAYTFASKAVAALSDRSFQNQASLGQPMESYFVDVIAAFMYQRLPDTVQLLKAVETCAPDLILVHNDVEPATRLLALYAQAFKIPCIHVPHAIYLDTNDRGTPGSDVHDLVTATHIACAGQYQLDWYRARSSKVKLSITGVPAFDRLAKANPMGPRAKELLGLRAQSPVVTYCSSWRQDTNLLGCHDGVEESYVNFLQATKIIQGVVPDVQFVISIHPHGNNLEWHKSVAEQEGVEAVITSQHLDVILNASDMITCYQSSNVLLEAAALGVARTMSINGFPNDPEIVTSAVDPDAIANNVLHSLSLPVPDYSKLLQKYLGPNDGKASERIVEMVRMISASK